MKTQLIFCALVWLTFQVPVWGDMGSVPDSNAPVVSNDPSGIGANNSSRIQSLADQVNAITDEMSQKLSCTWINQVPKRIVTFNNKPYCDGVAQCESATGGQDTTVGVVACAALGSGIACGNASDCANSKGKDPSMYDKDANGTLKLKTEFATDLCVDPDHPENLKSFGQAPNGPQNGTPMDANTGKPVQGQPPSGQPPSCFPKGKPAQDLGNIGNILEQLNNGKGD